MPVIDLRHFPPRQEEWPYPGEPGRKAEYDARFVACARVVCVMCHPDSEEDRQEFLRSVRAWTVAEAFSDEPPLPTDMAPKDLRMALADGFSLQAALPKAAESAYYDGRVSGNILLFILRCAEHSPKDMSVLKAAYVAATLNIYRSAHALIQRSGLSDRRRHHRETRASAAVTSDWFAIEMTKDPHSIVKILIEEHGLDGAISAALEETMAAHDAGDNYALSVWRDVKRLLRKRKAEA